MKYIGDLKPNLNSPILNSSVIKSNTTLKNDTEEDSDGGRESKVIFSGEQSGGEITTLAEIEASHDGTADDQAGDLILRTNDGNDGTSPTERLRINSAGDMLFSSDDPSLTLANTTHEDTEGGRESTIVFQGEQSGGEVSTLAQIEASHDGTADDQKGDLIFKTNDGSDGTSPTEAMRIDSSQNVGIGHTSPTAVLDVRRGDASGKIAEFHQSSGYGFELSSSASLATLSSGYNQDWAFTTDAGSGAVERMRLLAGGGLTFNGDTAAANALDDYEQGTFNFEMVGYHGSPSPKLQIAAHYTKIGNVVHYWAHGASLNTAGYSGNLWFTGLPFTAPSPYSTGNFFGSNGFNYGGDSSNSGPFTSASGNIVYGYVHHSSSATTAIMHNATTSVSVNLQGTYKV